MPSSRRFSRALTGIIAGFLVLSVFELIVALDHFKPALFLDGLHNLIVEGLLLGFNLAEHHRKQQGLDESKIPLWTTIGVLVIGLPTGMLGWLMEANKSHTGAALVLSSLSLGLCIIGARVVDSCGLEGDHNAESVLSHLAIDGLIAGTAFMVYLLELAGAPAQIDPISTLVSTVAASAIGLRFIFKHRSGHQHLQPGSH